jgi:hypothetical protein
MVTCPGPSGNRNRRSPAHSPPYGATEHGGPAVHAAATDSRPSPGVGWCGRSGPNCLSGRLYRLRGRSRPRPRRRVPSVEPAPPSPASADDPSVTAPPGIATIYAQSPPCLTPTGAGCLPRGVEVVSPRLRRRRDRRHAELHERPDRGEDHIAWLQEPREVGRRGDIHLGRGRSASKRSARASILVRFRPTRVGSSPRASSSRSTRCPVYPVAPSNTILLLSTTLPWCG